jgi:hypothetical protein
LLDFVFSPISTSPLNCYLAEDDALSLGSFLSLENDEGTHSGVDLQLNSEYDTSGIAEIFRLLLERRAAIPLLVPESKKHYLNLLRHVTLPRIDNISLGEKSLQRVAVIFCRQRDKSRTGDILKSVFNIDSLHARFVKEQHHFGNYVGRNWVWLHSDRRIRD